MMLNASRRILRYRIIEALPMVVVPFGIGIPFGISTIFTAQDTGSYSKFTHHLATSSNSIRRKDGANLINATERLEKSQGHRERSLPNQSRDRAPQGDLSNRSSHRLTHEIARMRIHRPRRQGRQHNADGV